MECYVCKEKIKINWGDSEIKLCELHSRELEELRSNNPATDTKRSNGYGGITSKIILVIINLIIAACFLPFVALSTMVFDSGFSWMGVFIVGIVSLVPIGLVLTSVYILIKE